MKFTNEDPPHVLVDEIKRLRHELAIQKREQHAVELLFKKQAELYNNLHHAHEMLLLKHYPTRLDGEIHHDNEENKWLARIRAWLNPNR